MFCCPNHRWDLGHSRACTTEIRRLRRYIAQLEERNAELELRAAATIGETFD